MINTYIKIRKLIERKQYKTARVLIDSALQQNSDDVELIYLLAIWFFEQKKYESAADYANHAIILNPNFLLGYHLLTMAKMNTKNYQEALNVIKQAKNIDSNFSELYWLEASIYHYFGHLSLSIDCLQLAISKNPTNEKYHYRLGLLFNELKRKKSAYTEFLIAVKIKPGVINIIALLRSFILNNLWFFIIIITTMIVFALYYKSFYFLIPIITFYSLILIEEIQNRNIGRSIIILGIIIIFIMIFVIIPK